MKIRITVDTYISGEPVAAGDEVDVSDAELWRLAGKFESLETPPETVESREPEPEHRDPVTASRLKGKKT
jgi:hypothetical protein